MTRSRLVLGLAAAFAAISVVFAVLAAVSNLAIVFPALLFGVVAYLFWRHGTGRLAARLYQRVERQAARNAGGPRRANGAGPKADWTSPYDRRGRVRNGRTRTRYARPEESDGPSASEAYEILDVEPGADDERLKAAYRERVRETHPDADDGDAETFKRVSDAYETLVGDRQ